MYILFGVLGAYVFLSQPMALVRMAIHPVFLAAYALVGLGYLIESMHVGPDYFELQRYRYMVIGGVVVAALCRDRRALQASLYGHLVAAIWLSVFLIVNFYSSLSGATATNLREASRVRRLTFAENSLAANLNKMTFQVAQGVVVAVALALTTNSWVRRNVFLGAALLSLVATFVPMSRSGVVIAIVSCLVVLFAYRGKRMRALMLAVALGTGILIWAPEATLIRLASLTTSSYYEEEADGRARIYAAAIEHLPEYVTAGVGAGNYWRWWGKTNGFGTVGAHNSFIQVTIYWGIMGLLALFVVIWQAYRCLPKRSGADPLSLGLLGISISLLLYMMVTHNLYTKEFSLGLGMLAGLNLTSTQTSRPSRYRQPYPVQRRLQLGRRQAASPGPRWVMARRGSPRIR